MTATEATSLTPSSCIGTCVRIEGVTKRFGEFVAVNNISLEIQEGEFVTLLGPSGSGKTTTLNMLAGFLVPDAGEIYLDDKPTSMLPPHKRGIGMVFQNWALFPHMTSFDNVAFPLKMRKLDRAQIPRRVEAALKVVGLEGLGSRYPSELSGGQQQRVALARALVAEPPLLLMDEPLGQLDKNLRSEMQLEIKHIQESMGLTTIYVTHDQTEALTMSDRIAVINAGTIEQLGTPTELYERPANVFVADFLGESNIFEGKVQGVESGHIRVMTSDGLTLRVNQEVEFAIGQTVAVVVRPERISLVPAGDTVDTTNLFPGRIKEVIYVGDFTRYQVQVGDRQLVVKSQHAGKHRTYRTGDEVCVAWNGTSARCVPAPSKLAEAD